MAKRKRYDHFLFLSPADVVEVCMLALELDLDECADYAEHLLASRLNPWAGPCLARLERHPNPSLRQRAREIRRDFHTSALPRLRIEALGEFRVLRGGEPIEKAEWQGNQPKRLLKALVARGARNVPVDVIIEDMWPDRETKAGKASFAVNLHRLRKVLEPDSDKRPRAASYIHLKANLVSLHEKLCSTDVEEFMALMGQAEGKRLKATLREMVPLCRKVMEIYRGDFLREEPYVEWAQETREDLRKKFLDFLMRMAAFFEEQGAAKEAISCCQRAIETDPLLETAYQRLMRLYSIRGKLTAAVRLYEECRVRLQSELGLEPDDLTKAIYLKILDS